MLWLVFNVFKYGRLGKGYTLKNASKNADSENVQVGLTFEYTFPSDWFLNIKLHDLIYNFKCFFTQYGDVTTKKSLSLNKTLFNSSVTLCISTWVSLYYLTLIDSIVTNTKKKL